MGCFSWMYSDSYNRTPLMLNDIAFIKCPDGNIIFESRYQCDGIFGGKDIYELAADWNRVYLSPKNIHREMFSEGEYGDKMFENSIRGWKRACQRLADFVDQKPVEYMEKIYSEEWKRNIGIDIACSNEDNAALHYPIKIFMQETSQYDSYPASQTDEYQGL